MKLTKCIIMIDFKQKMEEEERRARRENEIWKDEELLINSKKRRRITTYTIAVIVLALIFSGRILISSQEATGWLPENNIFKRLRQLIPSADRELKGEENDRVNVLLLGMGGEGHDGAYLTDTMILASFKPSTKQVALISIPRDLVSPVSGWRKVNSINAYAEQKQKGSGGEETTRAISELLEIQINYYVRADFSGFSEIIDELGGIEINVENTFDDYTYPIYGQEDNPNYYARFEHLHFDQGIQTMNGQTALKYARSRHALGLEGSDFARAKRQQLVLEAIKNKLLSSKTLLNPVMVTKLVNEFSKNISTDIVAWEALRFWDLFKDVDRAQIINEVLSDAPTSYLVSSKGEDGAYILIPRSGNFSAIRQMIQNIFNTGSADQAVDTGLKAPSSYSNIDKTKVVILNGTYITGLATRTSANLATNEFQIVKTGNAPVRDYTETIIYDLSQGKEEALKTLKRVTRASVASDTPTWINDYQGETTTDPDFLIVLGTDANR